MNAITPIALAAMLALALGACGGGGGGGTPAPTTQPPASASVSSAGFISFLQDLTAQRSDSATPLELGGFVAPTSETEQPAPI